MPQQQITINFESEDESAKDDLMTALSCIVPHLVDNVTVTSVVEGETRRNESFHDVLMVAFDLRGRSAEDVHYWLQERMPHGDSEYEDANRGEIRLDSWWVANDERFDGSDCDSAVFVSMGNQKAARALLRANGLLA